MDVPLPGMSVGSYSEESILAVLTVGIQDHVLAVVGSTNDRWVVATHIGNGERVRHTVSGGSAITISQSGF